MLVSTHVGKGLEVNLEDKEDNSVIVSGDTGRIQEFKARLLSTTGTKVIDTVLRKALDDSDKDQVACLKMCMDRLLPVSLFEKDAKGQRNAVTINITGLGETKVEAVETIDMVDDDES